ncbi:hypothetical protein VTK73DRAFT_806 [Phialemonium thermophilum]|uniref:CBM-cenC domain-containing protein n=1 Tax=Phialemonium thermophilum TaxID=223376 RepID=A0ABR3XDC1_9PEZI
MLSPKTFVIICRLLVVAVGVSATGCSHDNCLRAVIASAFPTRHGVADCSSYLHTTVTPAVSTYTESVTVPTVVFVSSTEVDLFTDIEIITAATQTEVVVQTDVVEETLTVVGSVVTVTQTVQPPSVTIRPPRVKRGCQSPSTTATAYPTYASACSSLARYVSACSCVGVFPSTTTIAAPSTTTTVTVVSTSTSVLVETVSTTETVLSSVTETDVVTSIATLSTTDATATVTSTTTATVTVVPYENIVRNGDFETGHLGPWNIDYDTPTASVTTPGSNSRYSLLTTNLYDNNLFELSQTLYGFPQVTYSCTYDFKFTNYYSTLYSNGVYYVPYVHVYVNNDYLDVSIPSSVNPNQWQTSTFSFTSSGVDILYFDCASPQPSRGRGSGKNYLSLDNIACFPERIQ